MSLARSQKSYYLNMLEVWNSSSAHIDKKMFEKIVEVVTEGEGVKDLHLSLSFVDEHTMRELNERHRGKKEATDVLSFDLTQDVPGAKKMAQIVVCPEKSRDTRRVVIHGLLHILGYDHVNQDDFIAMERKEEKYLNNI